MPYTDGTQQRHRRQNVLVLHDDNTVVWSTESTVITTTGNRECGVQFTSKSKRGRSRVFQAISCIGTNNRTRYNQSEPILVVSPVQRPLYARGMYGTLPDTDHLPSRHEDILLHSECVKCLASSSPQRTLHTVIGTLSVVGVGMGFPRGANTNFVKLS